MQKKIFTSLLMSPLALGAFANINVTGPVSTGWSTGSDMGGTLEQPDGSILGGLGAGVVSQTVNIPCPGKYQISFTSADNLKFGVQGIPADKITSVTVGTTTTFTFEVGLGEEGDVVFEVQSENPSKPFSFATSNLQIVFDFDTAKTVLGDALDDALVIDPIKTAVKQLATDNKDQNALGIIANLEKDAKAIEDNAAAKDGIQAQINAIPAESASDADKLKNYKANKFYTDPNEIQAQIDAIQKQTDDLNKKINNFNENYPQFVSLNEGAEELAEALAAQNNKIEPSAVLDTEAGKALSAKDEATKDAKKEEDRTHYASDATSYVSEACQDTANGISDEIDAYKAYIAEQYEGHLTEEVEFDPTKSYDDLNEEITDLTADVDAAYKNVADYAVVFGADGLQDKLNAAYSNAEGTILDIKSVDEKEYPGVFTKKQVDWLKNIKAALDAANEVLAETKGNIADATANLDANKAACQTAETAFSDEASGATTFANDLNAQMTAALAVLTAQQEAYTNAAHANAVNGLELTDAQKAEYEKLTKGSEEEEYLGAEPALKALENKIKSDYYAYTLDPDSYKAELEAAEQYIQAVDDFTSDLSNQIAAQDYLNKFIKTLNEAPDNLGVDGVDVDFNDLFKDNLAALKLAVNNVTKDTSAADLKIVTDGIQNNIDIANQLIASLTAAHNAYMNFSESIKWLTDNINADKATKLVDGTTYSGYATLTAAINTQPTVGADGKKDYTNAGYKAYDDKWKADYIAAISATTPDECDQLANALKKEIDETYKSQGGWEAAIANSFNTYMAGYMAADFKVAEDALNTIVATSATWADANNAKSFYSIAFKSYKELYAQMNPALAKTDKNQKLTACLDLAGKLKDLWGSVEKKGTINNMYQNVSDYNTFMSDIKGQIGDATSTAGTPYAELTGYINDTYGPSDEPVSTAYTTYIGWANAEKKTLEDLKTTLGTDLENLNVYPNKATTQSTITGCTERLLYPGGGIYKDILANESAHNAVLVVAQAAKKAIIDNLGLITSNPLAEQIEKSRVYIEKLTALRDTELVAADAKTEEAYVNEDITKNCVLNETALKEAYENIITAANSIYKDFDTEWSEIVEEHNNAYLTDIDWQKAKTNMNLTYVRAINAYNGYTQLNPHYTGLEAFKHAVKSNAPLFDYNAEADQLIADIKAYVEMMTKAHKAISEDEFNQRAYEGCTVTEVNGKEVEYLGSKAIIEDMVDKAKSMVEDFNKVGKAYYEGGTVTFENEDGTTTSFEVESLYTEAETKLQDMKTLLASAPYNYDDDKIKEILVKVQKAFDNGVAAWDVADEVDMKDFDLNPRTEDELPFYQTTIGYVMGAIATDFWSVLTANLNPQVVDKVWNPEYSEYVNGTKDLQPTDTGYIAGLVALEAELKGYKTNTKIDIDDQEEAFGKAKEKIEKLNTTVQAYIKNEVDDLLLTAKNAKPDDTNKSLLQTYEDQLKAYYQDAKNAVDAASKMDANSLLESQFDTDRDADIAAIEGLGQLVTLGGVAGQDYSAATAKVNVFKNAITTFSGNKTDANKAAAIAAQTAANTAVETACNTAYQSEYTYLANIVEDLKVAYNDAYAEKPTTEAEYLKRVNTCIADIEALNGYKYAAKTDIEKGLYTAADFYKEAARLESEISDLIVALNDIYVPEDSNKNVLKNVTNSLNEEVKTAKTAVTNGQGKIKNDLVAADYNKEFDALTTELNNLQAQYEAAGNDVIGQKGYYEAQIDAITKKLETLNTNVATAEVQAGFYDDLLEDWTAVETEYKALVKYTDSCGDNIAAQFADDLDEVNTDLQAVKTSLKAKYDARTLTATSSIDDELAPVTKNINLYQLKVRKAFGTPRSEAADAAIEALGEWINTLADKNIHLVPGSDINSDAIDEEVEELNDRLFTNNLDLEAFNAGTWNDTDFEAGLQKINDILAKYEAIIKDAQAAIENAQDNTYTLGDLNNDGTVNVGDLVTMRNLILDNVSYQDLLKKEAWLAYAANIVGDNQIDIADYTALVRIIVEGLDGDEESATTSTMKKISRRSFFNVARTLEAEGNISIQAVAEENGVRTYAITVSDPQAFVAGQLDLRVESTSRIVDVRGAERLENHDVDFKANSEFTRVLITSIDNAEFEGTDGVTLYVDVEGRSGLGFENALFADETAQTYSFANQAPVTTGVDSLYEGAKAVKEAIYDAAGRVMKKVQRGINIIRNSDGTVTKEMHK